MKTQFTSAWQRLTGRGVRLTPIEERLLVLFREHIPEEFHAAIDAQLEAYNLAQRQIDWRAINLFRMRGGKVVRTDLPPLPCRAGEVKLLTIAFSAPGSEASLHVVFWAVDRYLFGFSTGESLKPVRNVTDIAVRHVKHSWRSNLQSEPPATSPSGPVHSRDAG